MHIAHETEMPLAALDILFAVEGLQDGMLIIDIVGKEHTGDDPSPPSQEGAASGRCNIVYANSRVYDLFDCSDDTDSLQHKVDVLCPRILQGGQRSHSFNVNGPCSDSNGDEENHNTIQCVAIPVEHSRRWVVICRNITRWQDEFAPVLSHEFCSPLAVIDSSALLIKRRMKESASCDGDADLLPYIGDHVARIKRALRKMTTIVNRTLSLTRLENDNMAFCLTKVDLRKIIREACTYHEYANNKVEFHLDIDDLPQEIYADGGIVEQIISNILANACKYSPDGGVIEVSAKPHAETIVIRVKDSGIGIAKEEQERIFDKYFRGSNSANISGDGIGLYLSRRLAQQHGGDVTVSSAIGEGSCFTVTIRCAT